MGHASLAIRDEKGHKMRDVYVISKGVFEGLEEKGHTRKNIDRLILSYKTSRIFKCTFITLRGVQLVCKHEYWVGFANNIIIYRAGRCSDNYLDYEWDNYPEDINEPTFFLSLDAIDALKEEGISEKGEIIKAFHEQDQPENEAGAFRHDNQFYVVILAETDNTKYHHIIMEDEYWDYKSRMLNTENLRYV